MAKNSRDAYGADGEQKVLLIDPDKLTLVTDEAHPLYDERVHLPVDEALVASIMADGILENIGIVKDPENGKILVSFGRQRVRAAREANKRLKKSGAELILVPCVVKRNDMASLFGMSISENEIRQADPPIVRATKLRRFMQMGRDEAQAAIRFGISTSTVKNLLGLLEASAAVRKAVDKGEVSVSEGYKLAKLEPDEQREKLEKIRTEAPREVKKGKKRAAGAKKRREIVEGKKRPEASGLRARKDVEEMNKLLSESVRVSGHDKEVVETVLRWVLGEDCIADLYMEET